jgi:IS30 family transposase
MTDRCDVITVGGDLDGLGAGSYPKRRLSPDQTVSKTARQTLPVPDRGKELAGHKRLALASNIEAYFCDPQSPWQRGSTENTNRLLRQYLPHGTDLSLHSQAQLSAIARQLNERARKTLLYRTRAETFIDCVAATG